MRELFSEIYASGQMASDPAELLAYSYDNSRLSFKPELVLFPESEDEIIASVKICNENLIPLTCRGRGTATTGAALPLKGGVVLSLERMRKIIEFNPDSKYITVEPGISNQDLQNYCKKEKLFWGPNPSSLGFSSIGGNLACNSAGSRSLKYGTARDNTLALRFITADAKIIETGKAVSKQSAGFDFTRLLIGSEGMLGIISRATLKLKELPAKIKTARLIYENSQSAGEAIINIMHQNITPTSLEFIDKHSLDLIKDDLELDVGSESVMLIVQIDGDDKSLEHDIEQIKSAAKISGLKDFMLAQSKQDEAAIWGSRKALSPKLRQIAPKKINEDVVVPIGNITQLLAKLDEIAAKHKIKIVNFGHAGNGNLHVNLLINPDDVQEMLRAEACLGEVFQTVLNLGGSISGEHGIGIVKREFLPLELGRNNIELMHKVKRQFDPNGILNPGKLPNIR